MDDTSYICKRRHTLPSISFVDPAIVRFIEKSSSSTATSVIQDDDDDDVEIVLEEEEEEEEEEVEEDDDDDQRTTISTISLPQQLDYQTHYHRSHHKQSNLDQLWSRQEKYDNLELRLLALEESKKRFEDRLQALEEENEKTSSPPTFLLHQTQPMKPDQYQKVDNMIHSTTTTTTTTTTTKKPTTTVTPHDNEDEMLVTQHPIYIQLLEKYTSLQSKYHAIQIELKEKEGIIQNLLSTTKNNLREKEKEKETKKKEEDDDEEASYKEEDGFLIFDTTNMNGEIIHCKVKIPPVPLASPPASRVGSPHYYYNHHQQQPTTPLPTAAATNHHIVVKKAGKKNNYHGLNYNAPEWKHPTFK